MSDKVVFMTGAGGFIGRYILDRYLAEDCDLYLLEHGRFRQRLEAFLDQRVHDAERRERVHVVTGDIRLPRLGLDPATADVLYERTTHAIHLAALYNLSAPHDVSMQINVDGTRHVLDFLERARSLVRFAHTSTIAVVGKYTGLFREEDLDVGQGFKNAYDETKFLSERLVRERRDRIPTVILRPATVVGDSRTGAIEKIDGPYYALTMIARNMHRVIPDTGDNRLYIAPVDFIAEAYYRLFEDEESTGKVFHLIDPNPPTYVEFIEMACDVMGKSRPFIKLPVALMRPMSRLPMFERLTGVPPEAFEHSLYPIEYDTSLSAPALASHGVVCPSVGSYIERMVRYFLEHATDPAIRKGDWRAVTT